MYTYLVKNEKIISESHVGMCRRLDGIGRCIKF